MTKIPQKVFATKSDVPIHELMHVHPFITLLLSFTSWFYLSLDKVLVITALLDNGPDNSFTHEEGRALDVRIWGLIENELTFLVSWLNDLFGDRFGTSPGSHIPPRVAVLKKDHIHLQCRRGLTLDSLKMIMVT